MVILGGLEIVAAGYLLKELHGDSKEDEERRRRRRRREERDDRHRPHRHDDSPPGRPTSRPPQQQQLRPPQQGPSRPYSAPPPQNRPPMSFPAAAGAMGAAATAAHMWHQPPPQQGMPQSYGTWPQGPPQQQHPQQQVMQQQQQQRPPQQQWQSAGPPHPPPQQNGFVPQPLQRPPTNYPPPGTHIDMKTGKIQHDMFPPEMPRKGEAREYYEGSNPKSSSRDVSSRQDSFEHRRENSGTSQQRPQFHQPYNSQPQINVSPPQGYSELDSETPGRYARYGSQQGPSGREKSNSFSNSHSGRRYQDDEYSMGSPPPAYRE